MNEYSIWRAIFLAQYIGIYVLRFIYEQLFIIITYKLFYKCIVLSTNQINMYLDLYKMKNI